MRPDHIPIPVEVLLDNALTPDDIVWLGLVLLQYAECPDTIRVGEERMHEYRSKIPGKNKRGEMSVRLRARGYITQTFRRTKHMPQGGTFTDLGPRLVNLLPSHWLDSRCPHAEIMDPSHGDPQDRDAPVSAEQGHTLLTNTSNPKEEPSVLLPRGARAGLKPDSSQWRAQPGADEPDDPADAAWGRSPAAGPKPKRRRSQGPAPMVASDPRLEEHQAAHQTKKTYATKASPVMEIARDFCRRAGNQASHIPGADQGADALTRQMKSWGVSTTDLRAMVDRYWEPGFRRHPTKVPWQDFVDQRGQLANTSETTTRLSDEEYLD